ARAVEVARPERAGQAVLARIHATDGVRWPINRDDWNHWPERLLADHEHRLVTTAQYDRRDEAPLDLTSRFQLRALRHRVLNLLEDYIPLMVGSERRERRLSQGTCRQTTNGVRQTDPQILGDPAVRVDDLHRTTRLPCVL